MRTTGVLLVLTLAASTASVAVPVVDFGRGASAHAVTPRIVEIELAPAALTPRRLPASVARVRTGAAKQVSARLLSPARTVSTFSMLGLTWDSTADPDSFDLSVRTRSAGRWTSWQDLETNGDGPDARSADAAAQKAGTAPVWVGASDAFQVRLDRLGRWGVAALPTGLRALLIDPGTSAADAAVGRVPKVASSAHATLAWPTIHRRKEWGANEKLRSSAPRYTPSIQAAFVHHTAGTNNYAPADVPKILRGILAFHTKGRNWSDVGYNFIVDRFGRIWEGRAGGVERAVLGAHTGGFNSDSFGISVVGDYRKATPSAETLNAIARIIAWKFAMGTDGYVIDPLGRVSLVSAGGGTARYKAGTIADFTRVSGHIDAGRTLCPGKNLYAQLPTIRSMVATILTNETTYGAPLPPGTQPPPGDGVTTAQTPEAPPADPATQATAPDSTAPAPDAAAPAPDTTVPAPAPPAPAQPAPAPAPDAAAPAPDTTAPAPAPPAPAQPAPAPAPAQTTPEQPPAAG
ncbi:MAG: peptidoglycan recognition protein family protein [Sporichthyaceae bacterium]